MTNRSFGVNITLLPSLIPPDYHAYATGAVDEGVTILETAGNSPRPIIEFLQARGCYVIHKCTTMRHAEAAFRSGVDLLSIDGFECAGHIGEHDISTLVLLNRARQTLKTPFIASGGFADGSGLAAALSLGAAGVNMGTRFMCTIESPIHIDVQKSIVTATENDTQLVLRRRQNINRLFKNKISVEVAKIEKESTTGKFEEVGPLMSRKRGKQVFLNGNIEYGVWIAGQVNGLIYDIPSCKDLIGRIAVDASSSLQRSNKVLSTFKDGHSERAKL